MSTKIPSHAESENTRRGDHPITKEVDLCLFRSVSNACEGRILPFGVRQMIKDYARVSFDNNTLRAAVKLWCSDREEALRLYGDINDWVVSGVTDMAHLFFNTTFNDRIDRWDVGHVDTMERMFFLAKRFNQPLAGWNVSAVTTMHGMFEDAVLFNQPLDTWDVGQVTDMSRMFFNAESFNQPLSTWGTLPTTNICSMLCFASSFNQPLGTWNERQISDMKSYMFISGW